MPAAEELLARLPSRLVIDADDPVFRSARFVSDTGAARRPLTELLGPRSAGALLWSTFRTLARFPSETWLAPLLGPGAPDAGDPVDLEFWPRVPPPRSRLLWLLDHLDTLAYHDPADAAARARRERVAAARAEWRVRLRTGATRGDGVFEDPVDLGLVVRTSGLLLVVEAVYQGDIAARTPWDPQRDAVARALDGALDLAGRRRPALLFLSDAYRHPGAAPPAYATLLPHYRTDPAFLAARLPHRTPRERDRLAGAVHWLSWADFIDLVLDHSAALPAEHKRLLVNLVHYLKDKHLLHKGG